MITENVKAGQLLHKMLHNEPTSIQQADLPEGPYSLKLMLSELWSCQRDGITVYDDRLNILRTVKGHGDDPGVWSVAKVSDGVAAVAGYYHLSLSTDSGWLFFSWYSSYFLFFTMFTIIRNYKLLICFHFDIQHMANSSESAMSVKEGNANMTLIIV